MHLGIYVNIDKQDAISLLPELFSWLQERDIDVSVSRDVAEKLGKLRNNVRAVPRKDLPSDADMILALGGDGTILTAARLVAPLGKPVAGVNFGGLGFLTEIPLNDLYPSLERLLKGDYTIEKRMILTTTVNRRNTGDEHYFALNDVVIFRGNSLRMLKLKVHIDGEFFNTYISDGLIIATPTGSTAYSLSSGGPIVVPYLQSIILNPICPHALTVRPTLIAADSNISVEIAAPSKQVQLTVDGQEEVDTCGGTKVEVRRAPFDLNLVTFAENSFFDRLREKLQWGGLPHK